MCTKGDMRQAQFACIKAWNVNLSDIDLIALKKRSALAAAAGDKSCMVIRDQSWMHHAPLFFHCPIFTGTY